MPQKKGKTPMDITITVCTIAVAIATIVTLLNIEPRISKLEDRATKEGLEQSRGRGEANPNIQHLQNSGQTSPKDSLGADTAHRSN